MGRPGLGVNNMGSGADSPGTGWLGTVVAFLDDQYLGIPLLGSSYGSGQVGRSGHSVQALSP